MNNTNSNTSLEKLFDEEGVRPRVTYGREKRRCVICNSVNSPDIASELGEFSGEPFYDDLCQACYVSVQDAKNYFKEEDEMMSLDEYMETEND